jgi:hypothetical protein
VQGNDVSCVHTHRSNPAVSWLFKSSEATPSVYSHFGQLVAGCGTVSKTVATFRNKDVCPLIITANDNFFFANVFLK